MNLLQMGASSPSPRALAFDSMANPSLQLIEIVKATQGGFGFASPS